MENKESKVFDEETIERLNREQAREDRHPYTCSREFKECEVNQFPDDYSKDGVLIATTEGWVCPCGKYKQNWYSI